MVKMIKGTYGMQTGARVVPITPDDPPFSLPPEQEERLVSLGVAEYVDAPEAAGGDLMGMKMKELQAYARENGINFRVGETKEELVQHIMSAQAQQNRPEPPVEEPEHIETEEVVPEDEMPMFSPERAVQ